MDHGVARTESIEHCSQLARRQAVRVLEVDFDPESLYQRRGVLRDLTVGHRIGEARAQHAKPAVHGLGGVLLSPLPTLAAWRNSIRAYPQPPAAAHVFADRRFIPKQGTCYRCSYIDYEGFARAERVRRVPVWEHGAVTGWVKRTRAH